MKGSVTDQFFGVPVDEENKRGGQNPPNWHVSISTTDKLPATRFLTVIEVLAGTGKPVEPVAAGTGRVRLQLGDYTVTAELDAGKPSWLEVRNQAETCAGDRPSLAEHCAGPATAHPQFAGSTLLWEKGPDQREIFREETDQLPPVLRYGNRY